ncbi:ArsR/SmtB family transcription factor [Sphingomonas sp. ERG5]|uniref:ArsR/SmtB family transcription factor n=1 Tax=Sphingomonas sp. ERG5 TaxID=1381597 RepID=UPI00069158D3|nr:winged helix-turn-helix domain-containing protein [Sphingomonas sp. ERG5]
MKEGPDISHVAAASGDPTRARMLLALLQIPAMTAGELANEAGVAAQTASGHLRRLEDACLLTVVSQGRHRYFMTSWPGRGASRVTRQVPCDDLMPALLARGG